MFFITCTAQIHKIHIDENSRTIYTYYKTKSYKAEFDSYGFSEFLRVWVDGVETIFDFDENDICKVQKLWIRSRDKLYEVCDLYGISLEWDKPQIVFYKNKKLRFIVNKQMTSSGLVYVVGIHFLKK